MQVSGTHLTTWIMTLLPTSDVSPVLSQHGLSCTKVFHKSSKAVKISLKPTIARFQGRWHLKFNYIHLQVIFRCQKMLMPLIHSVANCCQKPLIQQWSLIGNNKYSWKQQLTKQSSSPRRGRFIYLWSVCRFAVNTLKHYIVFLWLLPNSWGHSWVLHLHDFDIKFL